MGAIKRVGKGFSDGDIIEFNEVSEPLYLYSNGKLFEITPQEYSIMISTEKSMRGYELSNFRIKIGKYKTTR